MNIKISKSEIFELALLILFNIIFFTLCREAGNTPWIAYAFLHIAFLVVVFTTRYASNLDAPLVLGLSASWLASTYFSAEMVVACASIALRVRKVAPQLAVHLVLLVSFIIAMVPTLKANEDTMAKVAERDAGNMFIKDFASQLKILIGKSGNSEVNKKIEKAYDILHSSPVNSSPAVRDLEASMVQDITAIREAVLNGDDDTALKLANSIIFTVEERNRKLRF